MSKDKEEERDDLSSDVEAFLAKGGKVQKIETGGTATTQDDWNKGWKFRPWTISYKKDAVKK